MQPVNQALESICVEGTRTGSGQFGGDVMAVPTEHRPGAIDRHLVQQPTSLGLERQPRATACLDDFGQSVGVQFEHRSDFTAPKSQRRHGSQLE